MNDHPSRAELVALVKGSLSKERARPVVFHLLQYCARCMEEVPALKILFGLVPLRAELTPEKEATYSTIIQSAFAAAKKEKRHLLYQKKLKTKIVALLEAGGLEALGNLSPKYTGLGLYEALLERSWNLRHDDPGQMIQLARLATRVAQNLDSRRYGAERVADFQCRAWAELGNAYRVADQLDSAEWALGKANELSELGSHDKILWIRLLDLQASLAGDRRQFGLACSALTLVYKHHLQNGDKHLAGKALVGKGLYTGYAGRPEEAIGILKEAFPLIDPSRDISLAFAAVHNQVTFLVDCRRFWEAKKLLFVNRQRLIDGVGRVNLLRVAWEEGRIDAGLGNFDRSIDAFFQAKQGFSEVGRPFDSALVSLELAAVLMIQKRTGEAEELVVETARVFTGLRIERETLGAILMLKKSFEMREASAEMVEEVAAFVRRSENDPNARFDPKPR